jgi:porin
MSVVCRRVLFVLCLVVAGFGGDSSQAAELAQDGIPDPSIATSLPQNGDPAGIRKRLAASGVTYKFIYTNDVLSNLSGGNRRGTVYQGKLEGQFTVDLEKLAGWKDFTLYANGFQTHRTGRIRRDYVGGLNTIAAIEAAPSTRLSELWLERNFLNGAVSFRVGQLVADNEFFFSDLSNMFMQTDWPTITAVNLPGSGPDYPLSTPGARVKFNIGKEAAFLLAIFNGDPAGPCAGDPDTCNRYGLNFRLRDPAFMIGEAQFRTNQGKDDTGLARTVKLGLTWDSSTISASPMTAHYSPTRWEAGFQRDIAAIMASTASSTSRSTVRAVAPPIAGYPCSVLLRLRPPTAI